MEILTAHHQSGGVSLLPLQMGPRLTSLTLNSLFFLSPSRNGLSPPSCTFSVVSSWRTLPSLSSMSESAASFIFVLESTRPRRGDLRLPPYNLSFPSRINQGMDSRAERAVHNQLVKVSTCSSDCRRSKEFVPTSYPSLPL